MKVFKFDRWIKKNKVYEAGAPGVKSVDYKIRIATSNLRFAGTSDKVHNYIHSISYVGKALPNDLTVNALRFSSTFWANAVELKNAN